MDRTPTLSRLTELQEYHATIATTYYAYIRRHAIPLSAATGLPSSVHPRSKQAEALYAEMQEAATAIDVERTRTVYSWALSIDRVADPKGLHHGLTDLEAEQFCRWVNDDGMDDAERIFQEAENRLVDEWRRSLPRPQGEEAPANPFDTATLAAQVAWLEAHQTHGGLSTTSPNPRTTTQTCQCGSSFHIHHNEEAPRG